MAETRGRIARFDNVKGLLIILVVAGHFMHPIHNDNPVLSYLFDLIYLFHMPLFVFMSGLFAKGAYRNGRLNVNRMVSFALLGLAYQVAYLAISGLLAPARILRFTSAPWYLIGMVWWYLATPVLAHVPAPAGVAISLVAALLGGCIDMSDGFLAISRSIAFLPYFALGYYCTTDRVERIARSRWPWAAVAAFADLAVARAVDAHAFDWFFPMVYGDNPYTHGVLPGMLAKLTAIACAVVCSLAAFKLVPAARGALTRLGERTLQVYVLHRLIRAWLTFQTPFYHLPVLLDPLVGTAIILALSGGVTAICAWRGFERPFARFMAVRWLPAPKAPETPEAPGR